MTFSEEHFQKVETEATVMNQPKLDVESTRDNVKEARLFNPIGTPKHQVMSITRTSSKSRASRLPEKLATRFGSLFQDDMLNGLLFKARGNRLWKLVEGNDARCSIR